MSSSKTSLIPECGVVTTSSEKIALLKSSYVSARNEIIQGLVPRLLQDAPHSWICSKYLFNSQTLPSSISVSKFGMEVWKSTEDTVICQDGTEVFFVNNDNTNECNQGAFVLLRHKFDNGYYYYRACSLPIHLQQQDESDLQTQVCALVRDFPNSTDDDSESLRSLTGAMACLVPRALENVMAARELRVGIVPRTYTISWKEQLVSYIQC
ncbi:hypothetical protein IV203_027781 [Nitzschia inconspicua]|uniref:Uncharacterized protein n=1 Tax=Nitzschia inconspicua TaxID=303405 RepID=A0A9K3K3R4_9STRA|nr:hypothetical protein IV203_038859 [Nitzschia inconspicua]KAG7370035.1 hypothetical protein IV203_027781 [Nitzschia inconspicua]